MPKGSNYKTLNSLMRHIRESAGIAISGAGDKRALAQMGYFHGYKGYRYSGDASRRIPYSDFAELRAVVDFDFKVKALLYPVLMNLEMTMKNLAVVQVLEAAGSSRLTDVYARLMPGDKHKKRAGKLEVIHSNSAVLLASYKRNSSIVRHYYDSADESVPFWALVEVITLGHFATLLAQLSDDVLIRVAHSWGMRRNDSDLLPHLVFALKDLRNCVAHNGVVFDTRFATSEIRKQVKDLLRREVGLPQGAHVEFNTITDHFMLVVFMACCLGFPKREVKGLIREYVALTDGLRARVPVNIFDMIVHTDNRLKLSALRDWVTAR